VLAANTEPTAAPYLANFFSRVEVLFINGNLSVQIFACLGGSDAHATKLSFS
jgi:hypothetical protein